jgi:hypothetical protein
MLSQSWAYDEVICIAVCKLLNGKEQLTIQTFCFLQALPAENGNICEFGTVYLQPWRWPEILLKDGQETINMMVDKLLQFFGSNACDLSFIWCFHTDVKLLKLPNPHKYYIHWKVWERDLATKPRFEAGQKLDMCNLLNGSCWHASSIKCLLAVESSSVA